MKAFKKTIIQQIINSSEYKALDLKNENTNAYIVEKTKEYMFSKTLFRLNENKFSLMKNVHDLAVIPHRHDFYEIQYVYSGNVVQIINGEEVSMPKGTMTVFNKHVSHELIACGKNDRLIHLGIDEKVFSQSFFEGLIADSSIRQYLEGSVTGKIQTKDYCMVHFQDDTVFDILNLMSKEYSKRKEHFEKNMALYLMLIINKSHQSYHEDQVLDENKVMKCRIEEIKSIISEEYQHITLSDLAEKIHVHPNYLSKFLKREVGIGFSQLLTQSRIQQACYLLMATNASVEEIAAEVGYKNPNYFYKVFKANLGITPSEFRQRGRSKMMVAIEES